MRPIGWRGAGLQLRPRSLMEAGRRTRPCRNPGRDETGTRMSGSSDHSGRICAHSSFWSDIHSSLWDVCHRSRRHKCPSNTSPTWVTRIPQRPAAIRIGGVGITVIVAIMDRGSVGIVAIMDRGSVCRGARGRSDHAQDLRRRVGASNHVVAGGRYDAISWPFAARAKSHCAFLHIKLEVAAAHIEPESRPFAASACPPTY